jgi:hypothetical protein
MPPFCSGILTKYCSDKHQDSLTEGKMWKVTYFQLSCCGFHNFTDFQATSSFLESKIQHQVVPARRRVVTLLYFPQAKFCETYWLKWRNFAEAKLLFWAICKFLGALIISLYIRDIMYFGAHFDRKFPEILGQISQIIAYETFFDQMKLICLISRRFKTLWNTSYNSIFATKFREIYYKNVCF